MKNHRSLVHITRFVLLFVFSSMAAVACTEMDAGMESGAVKFISHTSTEMQPTTNGNTDSKGVQSITVMDKAMNRPMAKVTIPAGWTLHHDVASNPQAGGFTRFGITAKAPDGGMYIILPSNTSYAQYPDTWTGQMTGYGFADVATYMTQMSLNDHSAPLQISSLRPSSRAAQSPEYKQAKQQTAQMGSDFEVYEATLTGSVNGQPWKGEAGFAVMDYSRQTGGQMRAGSIIFGAVQIAPARSYDNFEALCKKIKYEVDPAWDAAQANMTRQRTQQSNANHQSRMASNQAAFDAQQRAHRETQAAYQASNDAWYDRNLGAGSTYNSSASFNDAITGHSSFNDSYSGHQIKQEGHYNYWYSNGQGEYYGTDDASFNPASLQGNWQSVQPLSATGH